MIWYANFKSSIDTQLSAHQKLCFEEAFREFSLSILMQGGLRQIGHCQRRWRLYSLLHSQAGLIQAVMAAG